MQQFCYYWRLKCNSEGRMAATWKTKWGVRRVRRDTPTIEEALIAAESLANDPAQRFLDGYAGGRG